MSLPLLTLDAQTEGVAVALLRHLEWQPEGFSLVFLFADPGPAQQLADWLDERLRLSDRPLQRCEAGEQFWSVPEMAVVDLAERPGQWLVQPGAIWWGVHRHAQQSRWNTARRRFLARLNERRFLLERDLPRPLVLLLPPAFVDSARDVAPDLWHRRDLALSLQAPAPAAPPAASALAERGAIRPARAETSTPSTTPEPSIEPISSYLPSNLQRIRQLRGDGQLASARQLTQAVLAAMAEPDLATDPGSARDRSLALDELGAVAQAQGDWAQAEAAYRESLQLSRELLARLGPTPEAQRDLSVSLDNLGAVAQAQGDWTQAEAAYRERLQMQRSLLTREPNSRRAQESLLHVLEKVVQLPVSDAPQLLAEAAALRAQIKLHSRTSASG